MVVIKNLTPIYSGFYRRKVILDEINTKIYVCQNCGAYNTPRQAGRDFPLLCYYCGCGELKLVTMDEPDDMSGDKK
jgi:DNA-directed RNA polymerase subunit RPC12/RpoP